MKSKFIFILVVAIFSISLVLRGQVSTGGQFELRQTVFAGGGANLSGGSFSVLTTTGEQTAGQVLAAGSFAVKTGFQQRTAFAPTSAGVFVSGRVLSANGNGIRNAVVHATDQFGVVRESRTSSFGFYMIDGLRAGNVYVLTVQAKQYTFLPQTISVFDEISGLDLVAEDLK